LREIVQEIVDINKIPNVSLTEINAIVSNLGSGFRIDEISNEINTISVSKNGTNLSDSNLNNEIDSVITDYLNKIDPFVEGELSVQTDGTSKLDVQAFKYTIAPNTFERLIKGFDGLPLYLNISPEFNLVDKEERDEEKLKKLLNTTGGSLNITIKDYYRIIPFEPKSNDDLNIRWFYLATAKHLNEIDSTGTSNSTDFNYNLGIGANLEAQIVGEDGGVFTVEYQFKRFGTFNRNYEKIFSSEANKQFNAHTLYVQFKLFEVMDARLEYYKSIDSDISTLDDGFVIFSLGLSKSF